MGGADHYCRKIADDKGLTYHGTGCIVMPNNYVVMFDVPNHEEAQRKAEEILPEVAQAAQHISNNEELKAEAKVKSMQCYTFSTQEGKAYYYNSIPAFIDDDSNSIIGKLVKHSFDGNKDQDDAWSNQISELQDRLKKCGMIDAVRHLNGIVVLRPEDICALTSANAAHLIQDSNRGSLRPGARADIAVLNSSLAVSRCYVAGKLAYSRA